MNFDDIAKANLEMQYSLESDIVSLPEYDGFEEMFLDAWESHPENKSFKKSKVVEPLGKDDAEEYDVFLVREFDKWESAILDAVDRHITEETLNKGYSLVEKSFGQFLADLFNHVHTVEWFKRLNKVIKVKMSEGLSEAENEINLDIGVDANFDDRVSQMTTRQLEGFYVDGKRWEGLKGVADDLQKIISEIVREGVTERKSLEEIKTRIKDTMVQYKGGTRITGEVTDGRAMRIARTESTRFHNTGKLDAYQRSGLKGKKQWVSIIDDSTSAQCKALNGKIVGLNEPFTAEWVEQKTKGFVTKSWEGHTPPSHPNCRSVIRFLLD